MVTLYENYYMKIFKLLLVVDDIKIRIFKTEQANKNDEWSDIRANKLKIDVDCLCFETNTRIDFD